ncbi:FecR family protein [Arcticibacter tournemirensis]|uniref:FecR family protein n=1 Tax=Arcticibacter tournemirensis TaxID=699437 RepID=A0A4Q0M4S0_9SPHI|nr:FecR family protein [Arcticibacter tournemirensis]RXF67783.1 FecR family protein [Arcticibacter tournemirensis]
MRKQRKHYLKTLADKTAKGNTSLQEQQLLDAFFESRYETAKWIDSEMGDRNNVSETLWNHISETNNRKKQLRVYYKYATAASIALLFCLGFLLRPASNPAARLLTLQTSTQPDSLQLSDGSVIYLAANTRLQYPAQFGNAREISLLTGDAFFKIAPDPGRPFTISSGRVKTLVLGTSFHISMNPESCRVTVISGSVRISNGKESTSLIKNEEILVSATSFIKQRANEDLAGNWYEKDITLDNVPLSRALTTLKYKYGANFLVKDSSLLKTRLTLFIKHQEPLQNIVNQINYITSLKLKTHGSTIEVTP